jgi:hypothetical protein
MLRKKSYVIVIGTAMLFTLISCGGIKRINLAYTSDKVGPFPMVNNGQEIIVNKFKDNRSEKHIGEAKNYGGTVFYTVEPNNDVSLWVRSALATELEKAGCKVVLGENISDPQKFVINGTIGQISAVGVLSEMRVTLQVIKGNKILLTDSYYANDKVSSQNVYLTNYVKLFDVTLRDLMRQMIPQIITAVNEASRPN